MEENLDLNDIVLVDDAGEEVHFAHILTFVYEGERYVAMEPIDEDTDVENEEEAEVMLFHIVQEDGEDVYEPIDNEILQNEVFEEFLSLIEEEDEDA